MAESAKELDPTTLKAFEHAAAGHHGVMSDPSGELFIKPSATQEIHFYQQTFSEHEEFSELIPTFMGTIKLGAPDVAAIQQLPEVSEAQKQQALSHGKKIKADTAIVLENLEYGFQHPNVLDLKLGSKLYEEGTEPEKAARLDKVAAETTSGSLNFRLAGMKVWNGGSYDIYDKFYGRKFNADNVKDGFATFFSGLVTGLAKDDALHLLELIRAEIMKIRDALEHTESRMFSSSILVVYEGDSKTLNALMTGETRTSGLDGRAPTDSEVQENSDGEDEDEDDPPVAFQVRIIDFAHASWTPGQGQDDNTIKGLKNIEKQMDQLLAQLG
ncbi:Hypothetical protein R9X50_00757000 [Acrodontium crateriforme]|uniref:Kinase n=1 Tax=Acrodontium crateriforme TaxID=150365 RepID=A0AAQ3M9X4_9PEZI|nr:Hypothetical protein R9X50_00757000 [Acrodontium crateriforme]